ncbi:hypothetical protein BC829DRAFT_448127 [Chytridium lagenaria]|nr:hypothetical protein BC829DRAFT_448127 [Chytridium lagenaria]
MTDALKGITSPSAASAAASTGVGTASTTSSQAALSFDKSNSSHHDYGSSSVDGIKLIQAKPGLKPPNMGKKHTPTNSPKKSDTNRIILIQKNGDDSGLREASPKLFNKRAKQQKKQAKLTVAIESGITPIASADITSTAPDQAFDVRQRILRILPSEKPQLPSVDTSSSYSTQGAVTIGGPFNNRNWNNEKAPFKKGNAFAKRKPCHLIAITPNPNYNPAKDKKDVKDSPQGFQDDNASNAPKGSKGSKGRNDAKGPRDDGAVVVTYKRNAFSESRQSFVEVPPQCMAARLLISGEHFLYVRFDGDPRNDAHLAAYRDFLHKGKDKWTFFTFTRGQYLSNRGCIMVPFYLKDILQKITGLDKIKTVAKYTKYSSLFFTLLGSPVHSLNCVSVEIEDDTEYGGYCFTDGCGRISPDLAAELWNRHQNVWTGDSIVPSIFQSMKKLEVMQPSMKKKGRDEDLEFKEVADSWKKDFAQGSMKNALESLTLHIAVWTLLSLDSQYKTSVMYMTIDIWAAIDYLFLRGRHSNLQNLIDTLRKPPHLREQPMRRIWEQLKIFQISEMARWSKTNSYATQPGGPMDEDERLEQLESMGAKDKQRPYLPLNDSRRLYGLRILGAPDGGDLDGDTFMVIWDWRIVSEIGPFEGFDYRPDMLRNMIQNIAAKIGIPVEKGNRKKPVSVTKTTLIDRLTSKTSTDVLVAQVDSLIVELRKYESVEPPPAHPFTTPNPSALWKMIAEMWEDPNFMLKYRPPESRESIDLAMKILRLAERLITETPVILERGIVVRCANVVKGVETKLDGIVGEMKANPLNASMKKYTQNRDSIKKLEEKLQEVGWSDEIDRELVALKNEQAVLKTVLVDSFETMEDYKEMKNRWEKLKARIVH